MPAIKTRPRREVVELATLAFSHSISMVDVLRRADIHTSAWTRARAGARLSEDYKFRLKEALYQLIAEQTIPPAPDYDAPTTLPKHWR